MTTNAFLVVGLGNPGPTYASTRHNVGFLAVDDVAARYGASFGNSSKQRAQLAQVLLPAAPGIDAVRLLLAKPQTFMNESGISVGGLSSFHKIPPERVIVVHDELDLDPGRLRCKLGGGDNGHNGLKSIRAHLGTGDFLRVRVGIGRPAGRQPAADYVLAKLKPADLEGMLVDAAVAGDVVESLARNGLEVTQNRFNS